MPVLPTVLKCVACGSMTSVTLQSVEDTRRVGLPMGDLIKVIAANNLCGPCRAKWNWLASQGRSHEFRKQPVAEVLKPAGYREP